jgi:hypothetical protein
LPRCDATTPPSHSGAAHKQRLAAPASGEENSARYACPHSFILTFPLEIASRVLYRFSPAPCLVVYCLGLLLATSPGSARRLQIMSDQSAAGDPGPPVAPVIFGGGAGIFILIVVLIICAHMRFLNRLQQQMIQQQALRSQIQNLPAVYQQQPSPDQVEMCSQATTGYEHKGQVPS